MGVLKNTRAMGVAGAAAVVAMLLLSGTALATTRYAAPGGTAAAADCTNPAPGAPRCSIYTAAKGTGVVNVDEVVVEPGNYTDVDLDPDLTTVDMLTPAAANIHGEAGQPRPVITLTQGPGSPTIAVVGKLAHIEFRSDVRSTLLYLSSPGSQATGVIARSGRDAATACYAFNGVLRDSACLATGAGARAVGADGGGTAAVKLRNVTAISSGPGATIALGWTTTVGSTSANVKSTIARASATGHDLSGTQSAGATVAIAIDHSNYESTITTGGATINSSANQTGKPALAADGYHQLPSSTATINLGDTDSDSGQGDIDGQYRTIDGFADIGADELGHPTGIRFACNPASLELGTGSSSCHVEVDDTTSTLYTGGPLGSVAFTSSGPGTFSAPSCILEPVGIGSKTGECDVTYMPNGAGTHSLTGTFSPTSLFHEPSQGGTALTVTPPGGTGDEVKPPVKRCKKPKKKTRAAKKKFKKCKKKLRRAAAG
jgi:hypothetical protein